MDVNGLVFTRLNHEALRSAGEFPGLAGNCGLGGLFPRSFALKPHFGDLVHFTYRILDRGRLAVQGLRSPQLGIESLGGAFAGVPTELGLSAAVGYRVVVEGRPRELRGMPRDEIYCIGREAIINAYRHSRAKEIATSVEYRANELRIAVRDNGCGIDPRQLQWEQNGPWGLHGMQQRAERIGARLRIFSRVALGTEVELCLPGRIAFEPNVVRSAC